MRQTEQKGALTSAKQSPIFMFLETTIKRIPCQKTRFTTGSWNTRRVRETLLVPSMGPGGPCCPWLSLCGHVFAKRIEPWFKRGPPDNRCKVFTCVTLGHLLWKRMPKTFSHIFDPSGVSVGKSNLKTILWTENLTWNKTGIKATNKDTNCCYLQRN